MVSILTQIRLQEGTVVNIHRATTLIQQLETPPTENTDREYTRLGAPQRPRGVPSATCTAYGYIMVHREQPPRCGTRSHEIHYALWQQTHGACGLRDIPVMAWADEQIYGIEHDKMITHEIAGSEIRP
ncbi:hypothetical protein BO94DRAFT_135745 [Aspergillus sclerotioniger CBS 115572]|uniref:Uncharacterized protein n=1 Tax=Aspergillus sclerotioniger CBS 115572 TaxID=1450535 RepID=A0A317XCC2_9EURO|nr:hypothetical protein BO94DRAFT_135745 [Aspergillus sclerotioniger CBS 115572]PWY95761.1 hypothetical protein BO94DRAFT_135745 [Aspergillus sclerotioniger CBS 115572]